MAYKQYPNTYLSKLPYELQDKINDHIIQVIVLVVLPAGTNSSISRTELV